MSPHDSRYDFRSALGPQSQLGTPVGVRYQNPFIVSDLVDLPATDSLPAHRRMEGQKGGLSGDCRFRQRTCHLCGINLLQRIPYIHSIMQLALIGVSHKTAPVEIRERLAFPSEKMRAALEALMERAKAGEAMILSTCNRVEIVAEGPSDELIRDFLCEFHRIGADAVSDHLYSLQ